MFLAEDVNSQAEIEAVSGAPSRNELDSPVR
jgi:hypothetical protein